MVNDDEYDAIYLATALFFVIFSATKPSALEMSTKTKATERIVAELNNEVL